VDLAKTPVKRGLGEVQTPVKRGLGEVQTPPSDGTVEVFKTLLRELIIFEISQTLKNVKFFSVCDMSKFFSS